jgi:putative acetyltransferase
VIRSEQPSDYEAIRALHLAAFAPSTLEAEIADRLRTDGDHVPELCLVAREHALIGHVMLSKGRVEDTETLALGPIAVDPARQQQGIGTRLMETVIERARATSFPLIILLGHPTYYPRFGFRPAHELEIAFDAPPEAFMALALPAYAPGIKGRFRFPPAFH